MASYNSSGEAYDWNAYTAMAVALEAWRKTPILEGLQSAVALLREDEARKHGPLLDLNFRVRDGGSLLMLLIQVLSLFALKSGDAASRAEEEAEDHAAQAAFLPVLPFVCGRIRSSYDLSIKRPNGRNALELLVLSVAPVCVDDWSYRFAEALLDRGADVNQRLWEGQTPLISWARRGAMIGQLPCAPFGPLLLLQRGADINARDDDGTTCAHAIATGGSGTLAVAVGLADAGWLTVADLTLRNKKGDTALEVAEQYLWDERKPKDTASSAICCGILPCGGSTRPVRSSIACCRNRCSFRI
jgi:hypothetical protein